MCNIYDFLAKKFFWFSLLSIMIFCINICEARYLGRLSSNIYDSESVSNPYSEYGSPYSPDSINNPYGAGNPYSLDSPNNPYGDGWVIIGQ